jgi:hypothetical protein
MFIGDYQADKFDWRKHDGDSEDAGSNDEELEETPGDVLEMLGFDPKDLDLAQDEFNESDHPRGQPGNPGEFAKKGGGSSGGKKSEPTESAKATPASVPLKTLEEHWVTTSGANRSTYDKSAPDSIKQWDKGSFFADEDGSPLILYHQTSPNSADKILEDGFKLVPNAEGRSTDPMMPDGLFVKYGDQPIPLGPRKTVQLPVAVNIKHPFIIQDRDHFVYYLKQNVPGYDTMYEEMSERADVVSTAIDPLKEKANSVYFEAMQIRLKSKITVADKRKLNHLAITYGNLCDEVDEKVEDGYRTEIIPLATKMRTLVTDYLKSQHYDGLVMQDDKGGPPDHVVTTSAIVAFDPENQVKAWKPSEQNDSASDADLDAGPSLFGTDLDRQVAELKELLAKIGELLNEIDTPAEDAEFEEDKHPRARGGSHGGQFVKKGGEGGGAAKAPEPEKAKATSASKSGSFEPEKEIADSVEIKRTLDMCKRDFPHLNEKNTKVIGKHTHNYNCFAFAMGDKKHWWGTGGGYWPAKEDSLSIKGFDEILHDVANGEQTSDWKTVEPGYVKIAVMTDDGKDVGEVEHAVRQLPSGKWASKMGSFGIIENDDLHEIEGGSYGKVARVYKIKESEWLKLRHLKSAS